MAKISPKELHCVEIKEKQIKFTNITVFLVSSRDKYTFIQGIYPYGELGGILSLRRGLEPHSRLRKQLLKAKRMPKIEQ